MNSPTSKSEYFDISKSLSLPARCPLLNRCERRAQTIAIANSWPLHEAVWRVGLQTPIVKSVGETAYKIGGTSNFVFGGQCPEVNQFENTVALVGFSGKPTTKGDYDLYFPGDKHRVLETGHYSQCAEYASQSSLQTAATPQRSWLVQNYQWVIATTIALAGTIAAILALK